MSDADGVQDFRLLVSFEPNPGGPEPDEEYLAQLTPLSAAVERFEHEYFYSVVVMKAGAREDLLDLAFDVAYALTRLPGWLRRLAEGEGRAGLGFAAQGSERELIAERRADVIEYRMRPFFTSAEAAPPVTVSAAQFLGEWRRLAERLLDTLAALHAGLADDPQFKALRASLE